MLAAIALAGCGASQRNDGLDPTSLPAAVRPNYDVFAQRCSKCHGLDRALNAGVTDMEHWRRYVRRMRAQPNSGIAPADIGPIMAFLEYFTAQSRARREGGSR